MMYLVRGSVAYTAPFGSEFLGDDSEGIPVVYYRMGWVGRMVVVPPKNPREVQP